MEKMSQRVAVCWPLRPSCDSFSACPRHTVSCSCARFLVPACAHRTHGSCQAVHTCQSTIVHTDSCCACLRHTVSCACARL
eukprot:3932728-Rhodomonas_salina.1